MLMSRLGGFYSQKNIEIEDMYKFGVIIRVEML